MLKHIIKLFFNHLLVCVRGSPMLPLVVNICAFCTNLIANGTIGKQIGANGNAKCYQPIAPLGEPRTHGMFTVSIDYVMIS